MDGQQAVMMALEEQRNMAMNEWAKARAQVIVALAEVERLEAELAQAKQAKPEDQHRSEDGHQPV